MIVERISALNERFSDREFFEFTFLIKSTSLIYPTFYLGTTDKNWNIYKLYNLEGSIVFDFEKRPKNCLENRRIVMSSKNA